MDMESDSDTIYGTNDDCQVVMSERVQSLAGSVYQEFERMIAKYDEDVVKELMPLIVNVLETLDISCTENQEHEVELELLREDNEQLVTQYEREKQLRKVAEQKCLELEDTEDGEKKDLECKVGSLESILRMLELKSKNSSDHVSRLEDKENEMKKEYTKLHERYTELFKTHMDYMERTKILMGTDRLESLSSKQRPSLNSVQGKTGIGNPAYSFTPTDTSINQVESPYSCNSVSITSPESNSLNISSNLQSEIQKPDVFRNDQSASKQNEGDVNNANVVAANSMKDGKWVEGFSEMSEALSTPEIEEIEDISNDPSIGGTVPKPVLLKNEVKRPNTLYQELSFQDHDALTEMDESADITVNDNFFGMGKEVENLIMENNELLATKNALNVVKDDLIAQVDQLTSEQEILKEEVQSVQAVKNKFQQKIKDLEEELKKFKEESEKNNKSQKSDDDVLNSQDEVPLAQRKRFTRVEMARVLMERNQYKEKFMELQEAVRWTEMIRASRSDPPVDAKKSKSSVWKIFSNLFSTTEKPQRKPLPYVNVKYNAPTSHVSPALDTMRKKKLGDKHRGIDFLDSEITSEKLQQQRAKERREQYKQVRAHVKKDDGRMQAYGWSLPAKPPTVSPSEPVESEPSISTGKSPVPVPVPVYCRPLLEKEPGMKIWCAAGVNLTGGRTRDGGSIVGASVFYSQVDEKDTKDESNQSDIEKLNNELKEHDKERRDNEGIDHTLSSMVWICTSTHSTSKVTVIDANNPGDVLESFQVCNSHLLCVTSVPGAKESDYAVDEEIHKYVNNDKIIPAKNSESPQSSKESPNDPSTVDGGIGNITFVSCSTGSVASSSPKHSKSCNDIKTITNSTEMKESRSNSKIDKALEAQESNEIPLRFVKDPTDQIRDGVSAPSATNDVVYEEIEKMSSVLPTMWLGSQSGHIYIHSAVAQWKRCIHSLKLKDSVLNIVHIKGRVLAALADGTVAIFHRASDGQWDVVNYYLLDLGRPHHSIRCISVVHNKVWCGYKNKIHVVNPKTMAVEKTFDAHPRKESQVRQMTCIGDGVWISIRLDSTLRLYHAHTYQHLQDVDIEPYVSKMLGTGKLGFSFVRITALLISSNRLWMGTGNGVIISVPLAEGNKCTGNKSISSGGRAPGGFVRVYADSEDQISPASFIPYCTMAQAQLSFHGHRDAVKFFCAVPGVGGMSAASQDENKTLDRPKCMLVISGGEGYVDFRIGDGEDDDMEALVAARSSLDETDQKKPNLVSKGERSHLIVWQVTPVE